MFFNKKNNLEVVEEEVQVKKMINEDEMFALKVANEFSEELTKSLLEEEQGTAAAINKVKATYNEIIANSDMINETVNLSKKDFVILFVGRIAEEKNILFLIDAQKELNKKYKNIKLVIVGDGPDKEKYENLVKKSNQQSNIIFTGKASWNEMPYYYHISSIFATASKSETQGLTIIEAMASNVVPVCMDDEAFRSMVVEDLNGLFFKTEEEYIKKVLYLYENKKDLENYDKQARIQAEQYGSSHYASRVLDVYKTAQVKKKGFFQKMIDNLFEQTGIAIYKKGEVL